MAASSEQVEKKTSTNEINPTTQVPCYIVSEFPDEKEITKPPKSEDPDDLINFKSKTNKGFADDEIGIVDEQNPAAYANKPTPKVTQEPPKAVYIKVTAPTEFQTDDDIIWHNFEQADAANSIDFMTAIAPAWFKNHPGKNYADLEKEFRNRHFATCLIAVKRQLPEGYTFVHPDPQNKDEDMEYECQFSCMVKPHPLATVLWYNSTYSENLMHLKHAGNLTLKADISQEAMDKTIKDLGGVQQSNPLKKCLANVRECKLLVTIRGLMEKDKTYQELLRFFKYMEQKMEYPVLPKILKRDEDKKEIHVVFKVRDVLVLKSAVTIRADKTGALVYGSYQLPLEKGGDEDVIDKVLRAAGASSTVATT